MVKRKNPEEVRISYLMDRSLPAHATDDMLLFRALLDDSIACHYFRQ